MKILQVILLSCVISFAYSQDMSIEQSYYFVSDHANKNDTSKLISNYEHLARKCHNKHKYFYELGKLAINSPDLRRKYFALCINSSPEYYFKIYNLTSDSTYHVDYLMSLATHKRQTKKDSVLCGILRKMNEKDQLYRKKISEFFYLSNTDYPLFKLKFDSLMTLQKILDAENQNRLDSLIGKIGWPDLKYVNEESLNFVFTIAQHCIEIKKREKYLKLIRKSVEQGNDSYSHLAFYTDRTLMFKRKDQLFGTENIIKDASGMQLYNVSKPEKLNERRIIYGLSPIKE